MKKFFIKLALFASLILAIDLTLSRLLDYGRPVDYAAFVDSKKGFDDLKEVDILFLGDSQTADAFVPSVFEEKLEATAFNYGVYQLSPFEGYFLLKDLLERREQPPQLVVLGTDAQMFRYPVSDGKYSPLFIENPLNLLAMFYKSSNLGAMTATGRKKYLFSGLINRLVTGQVGANVRRAVERIENGYLVNQKHFVDHGQFDCNKDRGFFSEAPVAVQKEYFLKTVAYLQEQEIPFVVAHPPMHKNFLAGLQAKPVYEEFRAIMAEVESQHRAKIFNPDHVLLMNELQDEEFLDGDHLCYSGARKFSAAFADYLREAGFRLNATEVASSVDLKSVDFQNR
jgi:hypothetical protein